MNWQKAELFFPDLKSTYHNNEKTLLACSGGPDSIALLYLLLYYRNINPGFDFHVFHLNHQLRSKESDSEELFVHKICKQFQIEYHSASEPIKAIAKEKKLSIEEAAREIRYLYLNRILNKENLNSISTAHHLDDRIETFLIRLCQGGGPKSLINMEQKKDNLRRPLLSHSKKELHHFLKANKLTYCLDSSNEKEDYLRNKVRLSLIPKIQEIFPAYQKKMDQLFLIMKSREDFFDSFQPEWARHDGYQLYISLNKWSGLNEVIQNESLVNALKQMNPKFYLSYKNIQSIIHKIGHWTGKEKKIFYTNQHFSIIGSFGCIFLVNQRFYHEYSLPKEWNPGDSIFLHGKKIENSDSQKLYLLDNVPGMRINPNKKKKVKDFLIDKKIHAHWREHVKLIKNNTNELLGVIDPVGGELYSFKAFPISVVEL